MAAIVNPFTTDGGNILLNIGPITQLENEAQLAFILCHEVVHFTEHHIINAYIQNEEITNEGAFKRSSFDEKILTKSRHSKNLEKDAHCIGLNHFLQTRYTTARLLNVYEVLRYAHLPFNDIPFNQDFFNTDYYSMDESYFLNQVRPVEPVENDDQIHSTHPSSTERQQLLRRSLSTIQVKSGFDYLVSEHAFYYLPNVCRFKIYTLYVK